MACPLKALLQIHIPQQDPRLHQAIGVDCPGDQLVVAGLGVTPHLIDNIVMEVLLTAHQPEGDLEVIGGLGVELVDHGDYIALVGNLGASGHLLTLGHSMGKHVTTKVLPVLDKGRQLPEVRLSDHSPFWDAGYNAVLVTDTSFLRNPHYHKPSDTIETLDLPFLMAVIDGLESAISAL